MKSIKLRHSAWFGDKWCELDLPEGWNLKIYTPQKIRELNSEEISNRLNHFVDSLVNERAIFTGKVALIVDDISRPTPVSNIILELVEMLVQLGIKKTHIFIIIACGAHDSMTNKEIKRKLGDRTAQDVNVICHNAKGQVEHYGRTANGTPIFMNHILKSCELKIGIGGTYPHQPAGFGGGSKILLGVSGFKTITYLHYHFSGTDLGGRLENEFRFELEEIAKIVNLDGMINVIINENREITEIFAGDVIDSHKKAVEFYKKLYSVPNPDDADVVIANTYPFDTTLLFSKKGWWPINLSKHESTNILVGSLHMGLGNHGIQPIVRTRSEQIRRKLIVYSSLPLKKCFGIFLNQLKMLSEKKDRLHKSTKDIIFYRPENTKHISNDFGVDFEESWPNIVEYLKKKYNSKIPKIVVYSCAPLQYPQKY
jgi:nickel-dependent lactate racemase